MAEKHLIKENNQKKINALIKLLDDTDLKIVDQISNQIILLGTECIKPLELAWESTLDENLQRVIENIIHAIQINNTKEALLNWLPESEINLLEGYLIITQFLYPDLDIEKIKQSIDKIIRDIWLELNENLTGLEKIKVINHIFFDVYKFKGHIHDLKPHTFYINNVLESKTGNAMSIGLLYLLIAQRNNLNIYGVDLPEHFILTYTQEPWIIESAFIETNKTLFYINPVKKGTAFTRTEIELFLKEIELKSEQVYFNPCLNKRVIKRLITELIEAYKQNGEFEKINDLEILLEVFE